MKPVTIEIHGTGIHNRGAELMAIAIAERMRAKFPGVRLVVPPSFGPFDARARHGFLTTWEFPGMFRTRAIARLLPKSIQQAAGIIHPAEVDVVLDASGFAFSDQWGSKAAQNLVKKMVTAYRRRQPLVLLPQAFGPFKNADVAKSTRRLLNRASLVCGRDARSYADLKSLSSSAKIRQFPDFTTSVKPKPDSSIRLPPEFVAIVPNKRMLDKGSSASEYIIFLRKAVANLESCNVSSVFVLHDASEDREVVAQLAQEGKNLVSISHDDPRVLKWMLGKAMFVVGSRFHALVSAFAQGVPCIGAGWSHKYPELFADFECANFLISDLKRYNDLEAMIGRLRDSVGRQKLSSRIAAAAVRIQEQSEVMWCEVESIIRKVHSSE